MHDDGSTRTIPDVIVAKTERFVRARLSGEATGHDWFHTDRVRRLALRIARDEATDNPTLDLRVIELAALLHDLQDWKFAGGDESAGPRAAAAWLTACNVDSETIAHVAGIVATLSFKGAGVPTPMATIEGAIVQDADRLDAIGAIGIARAFAYGGSRGRLMHDPGEHPEPHGTFAAYKASTGTTINHFSEKLLLLRDRMNTASARRLAAQRHAVMEAFLSQFLAEWDGRD